MSSARVLGLLLAAGLVTGCVTSGGTRIDNIPMYGQPGIERPARLKQADEDFIREATKGFGSRQTASRAWFDQGDDYMDKGDLDYAMRRYNQAWLLDPENYQPYWGFARVMVAKDQYDDSFTYFKKAIELVDDLYQKPALLSDFGIAYHNRAYTLPGSQGAERQKYFNLANQTFEEATMADPTYFKGWLRWAQTLYFQEKYSESWRKVKKARELNAAGIPVSFIEDLRAEMPEPPG